MPHIRNSHSSRPDSLVELEPLMNEYVISCIKEGKDGSGGLRLIKLARTFDELVVRGIGYPKENVGHEAAPVLGVINGDTELKLSGGRNFSQVVTRYYRELEANIEQVIWSVRTDGISYLMSRDQSGNDSFNERAADDMEALSKMFGRATDEVRDELCLRSPAYLEIEEGRAERVRESIDRFKGIGISESMIPSTQKHMLLHKLQRAVHSISNGTPVNLVARDLLVATNDLMHHLGKNHGERGLQLVGRRSKIRPIDSYNGEPFTQLAMIIELLNDMIHDYEDCVVLHRDLLLGAERQ